jgi:hypothetical protein
VSDQDHIAMPASPQPTFNDDLLLSDVDRKEVARSFPTCMHVLDFPELRQVFDGYDLSANRWKKNLRRAGLATIALGVIALLGASTEPLYGKLPSVFSNAIVVLSALAGLLSIVISTFGVLHSASKNRWLEARLMTERLRQFQFQTLVFRIPTILRCAAAPKFDAQFGKARERWFSTFKIEHVDHLPAKLKEVLDDDSEEQFQLHGGGDALDGVATSNPLLAELFAAYRLLRIRHQILYANFKLGGDSLNFPRKQVSLLSGVSLICILLVFFAHFAVSISSVSRLLPYEAVADGLSFMRGTSVHVLIIWTVIVALAARTFEEGLQPTREVERYTAYRARLGRLLYHFDEAANVPERVRIMTEVERLVYQEMREFLKTNFEARFVL